MASILVVDDDINILEVIQARLEACGHTVEAHPVPAVALENLKEKDYDVIISDIRMPQIDGMEFLYRVRNMRSEIPVILLTAYGTIPSAVEAIKKGAFEYLTKPFQGKQLLQTIEAALQERDRFRQAADHFSFPGIFGESPRMKALQPVLERIVESESTVLIQGESGTGKELIAQMIHYSGHRRDHRFVVVDCGATPAPLIESELFGHARGSFTNATESRKGMFEIADKGTLFLDEISTMPLDLQTRLLRVLQEGQIKRVGENVMRAVDVRVVAATNKDLKEQVEKGLFRLDLYYRMAVLRVELPPLRERTEDIPLLAEYFLESFSRRMKKDPMELSDAVMEVFLDNQWPGNIRELKNVIEAAVVLARGNVLQLEDIEMARFTKAPQSRRPPPADRTVSAGVPLPKYLEQQEREMIMDALRESKGVQKDAARLLGISARVLCYKIKKMRIDMPGPQPESAEAVDPGEEG